MIWAFAGIALVIWVGRKMLPTHMGDDILKLQLFQMLRFKNARDAAENMSFEDLEKRLWLRINASLICECASSSLFLKVKGLSWMSSLVISVAITILSCVTYVRFSRTYRHITLPLFATLCRMPQSRWDMRTRPATWVKVNIRKGRVWIRLPKDWHAHKRQLEVIRELVDARLPGHWLMEANTRKFLLTFRKESEAETISVLPTMTAIPEPPQDDDRLEFVTMDKEIEDEPW